MPAVKTRSCVRFPALLGFLWTFSSSAPAFALGFTDLPIATDAGWVDTGIIISVGELLTITATGSGLDSGVTDAFFGVDMNQPSIAVGAAETCLFSAMAGAPFTGCDAMDVFAPRESGP